VRSASQTPNQVLASNRARRKAVKAAVVPAVSSSWQIKNVPQLRVAEGKTRFRAVLTM